jgi:hypothetical protein
MDEEVETAVVETPAALEADKLESRHDALSRAFDEVAAPEKSERPRDDAGRFAPKAAEKEKRPVLTAKGPAPQTTEAAPAPTTNPWDAPPKSWKKEVHDKWTGFDPDARKYIHEREEQMRAGVEGVIPKAKYADQMQAAIAPFAQNMQAAGITDPVQATRALWEADHRLRSRDPQYALGLLQSYGYDMQALLGVASQPADVVAIRQEAMQWKQRAEAAEHQLQSAQSNEVLAKVNAFKEGKANWDAVAPVMRKYLERGLADSLEEAYDIAIRLNPSLAPPAPPAAIPDKQAAHNAAQRARAAAVSVRGATPGTTTTTKAQDRRSLLRESLEAVDGRL